MASSMTAKSARRLAEFALLWENICVLCGHEFLSLACVTVEHLVPVSMGGTGKASKKRIHHPNMAPSHWRCNQRRGTRSMVSMAEYIERRQSSMSWVDFLSWLNAAPPDREVPDYAYQSPKKLVELLAIDMLKLHDFETWLKLRPARQREAARAQRKLELSMHETAGELDVP